MPSGGTAGRYLGFERPPGGAAGDLTIFVHLWPHARIPELAQRPVRFVDAHPRLRCSLAPSSTAASWDHLP
jgi:hypothetical protein